MPRRDREKAIEVFLRIGTTLNREKINDLNEEIRLTITRLSDGLNQLFQSRQKSIITDAQQWPARNVAHAGRFHHECRWFPFGKSSIPIEIVLRDESVFRRAPRHHRRNPRATVELQ